MTGAQTSLLLSICIPTRGRNEILQKTLTSIFSSQADAAYYEVVIYDSAGDDELKDILSENYPYPNIVYKQGENRGFLNLTEALKMGRGSFLKLHNDYSEFTESSLSQILDLIRLNLVTKPILFFKNGGNKDIHIKTDPTFDSFLYDISYYSSWSTAFGIWKTDLETIANIDVEPMFPHTSLLFALDNKQNYMIIDSKMFNNHEINKKGGYNLFETFAVTYLGMVSGLLKNNSVSRHTFQHIKTDMFWNFLIPWYRDTKILKNQYTFILTDIKPAMATHYSISSYYSLVVLSYISVIWKWAKDGIKKILAINNKS